MAPYDDDEYPDDVEDRDLERDEERSSVARRLDADSILDTLVPESIDWRNSVRRHPMGSVMVIGLVGYLVGRTKGAAIMAGLTAGLSSALMRQLGDVFEGDFFEF
jgi:hypothetical protein